MVGDAFNLGVSYSQLAVFLRTLPQPFSNWTDRHVAQGFAWRPGSVSFGSLVEFGIHKIDFEICGDRAPISAEAIRAIEVPFDVPDGETVDVASIGDAVSLAVPTGRYQLRCEFLSPDKHDAARVKLTFMHSEAAEFRVVRADSGLAVDEPLLTTAEPAT